MTHVLKFAGLLAFICILQTVNGLRAEEYKRALEALGILEEENSLRRRVFTCKALGEDCSGVVNCCGTTQCYWEKGYSMTTDGECVTCVKETKSCRRDDNCCSDLQCDKGNALWVDGTCQKYRREGSCYRDGQCVTECVKEWYETTGTCT